MRGLRRITSSNAVKKEQDTRFAAAPGPARVFEGGFYKGKVLQDFISQVPGANIHHALAVVCGDAT